MKFGLSSFLMGTPKMINGIPLHDKNQEYRARNNGMVRLSKFRSGLL